MKTPGYGGGALSVNKKKTDVFPLTIKQQTSQAILAHGTWKAVINEREGPLFIHNRVAHSDAISTCYQLL